jgi:hypothetical protein
MSHKWISADADTASCLTCGGLWTSTEDAHVALDGELAAYCSGNTSQCHHYSDECPVDECKLDPECNCLSCHS